MVVLRFMRRDFMATKTKMRRNTFYPHMRSDSHEQKRKMQMTLLFQVRGDVIAITKKKKEEKNRGRGRGGRGGHNNTDKPMKMPTSEGK